ncbi:hypothetical protein H0A71_13875 [Alcaligenaceae bacterium]|nr:hypothetical protein [Alcaligenaceae bacterium]
MKLPSDIQILNCIFNKYKDTYSKYGIEQSRSSKIYVPIDCKSIANDLKTEPDIVFGRLYYHLERKYGYEKSDGSKVHLFALKVGNDPKCVNFPLLASVLAGLQEENRRHFLSQGIALGALIVSVISLLVALKFDRPHPKTPDKSNIEAPAQEGS